MKGTLLRRAGEWGEWGDPILRRSEGFLGALFASGSCNHGYAIELNKLRPVPMAIKQ